VLVVVLITLMVASAALMIFIEKASDDLLVEAREIDARRLRSEAYSALETTLCVINEFKLANGSLRSPAEGWSAPLAFAGYEPASGRQVEVQFEDESGKLSLPKQTTTTLVDYFVGAWQMPQADAEKLADAILDWGTADYVAPSGFSNTYEDDEIPFGAPGRPLRSWSELAAIDLVRDYFFDELGAPNDKWRQFTQTFSLLEFQSTNVNGAAPGVLTALGMDSAQQGLLSDYLAGRGAYEGRGAGYFTNAAEAAGIAGGQANLSALSADIKALRVIITVKEGQSSYRLNTVVSLSGNAAKAVSKRAKPSNRESNTASTNQAGTISTSTTISASSNSSSSTTTSAKTLNYPFTILELRENDAIPQISAQPELPPQT